MAYNGFGAFCHVLEAVKLNASTSTATKKEYEAELQKWFSNARDRGVSCRKNKRKKSTETEHLNENTETENMIDW